MREHTCRSLPFPALALAAAALSILACASQRSNAGAGRTVLLTVGGCRTVLEHAPEVKPTSGVTPLPDADLCTKLKQRIDEALTREGYAAAKPGGPADLTAKLTVTQHARAERQGNAYSGTHRGVVKVGVLVSVSGGGRDLDQIFTETLLESKDRVDQQLAETATKLASDVASSSSVNGS